MRDGKWRKEREDNSLYVLCFYLVWLYQTRMHKIHHTEAGQVGVMLPYLSRVSALELG